MVARTTFHYARAGEPTSAFDRGSDERVLRVLVDAPVDTDEEALNQLAGFSYSDLLEVTTLGMPSSRELRLGEVDDGSDQRLFTIDDLAGQSRHHRGLWRYSDLRREAKQAVQRLFVQTEVEATEALEVLALARNLRVDCLVSTRNLVWVEPRETARANLMSAEDALAIVGFFLRSRDSDLFYREPGASHTMGRAQYFWELTKLLLPSSRDWWVSCGARSEATGDESAESIAAGVMRRFQHALVARDHLQIQARRAQTANTIQETLFYFEVALVMLAGVYDGTARVANLVYAVGTPPKFVNWQNDSWRSLLKDRASGLWTYLEQSHALPLIRLTATLRNNIHGEDFAPILVTPPTAQREALVRVPSGSEERVRGFISQLGGLSAWGDRDVQGGLWIEAETLVDRLLTSSIEVVDRLMHLTDAQGQWEVEVPPSEDSGSEWPYLARALRRMSGL